MRSIFISYRRDDSQLSCDRLYGYLAPIFGVKQVFRDLDAIPGGLDFRTSIEHALSTCKVLLVVIGPTWTTITDTSGRLRLDDPNDLVRLEVETALRRGIAVLPLLVQGATPPPAAALPPSIQQLSYQNMRVVRADPDFARDMQAVMLDIAAFVPIPQRGSGGLRAVRNTLRRTVSFVVGLIVLMLFVATLSTWIDLPIITALVKHVLPH